MQKKAQPYTPNAEKPKNNSTEQAPQQTTFNNNSFAQAGSSARKAEPADSRGNQGGMQGEGAEQGTRLATSTDLN